MDSDTDTREFQRKGAETQRNKNLTRGLGSITIQVTHGQDKSNMKTIKFRIGILFVAASVISPFVAVWLSAHQMIYVETEHLIYFLCSMLAFLGSLCLSSLLASRLQNILWFSLICFSALLATYKAIRLADNMFAHLLFSNIPDSTWRQMASEIQDLANSRRQTGVGRNDLPKIFNRLGRVGDCVGVTIVPCVNGDIGVRVAYGSHSRRWGLLVGPDEFLNEQVWSKYRRISVVTNAVYFIGSD